MVAVASPRGSIVRLPGATAPHQNTRPTEATEHGGLDDDPAVQQLVCDLIHSA